MTSFETVRVAAIQATPVILDADGSVGDPGSDPSVEGSDPSVFSVDGDA